MKSPNLGTNPIFATTPPKFNTSPLKSYRAPQIGKANVFLSHHFSGAMSNFPGVSITPSKDCRHGYLGDGPSSQLSKASQDHYMTFLGDRGVPVPKPTHLPLLLGRKHNPMDTPKNDGFSFVKGISYLRIQIIPIFSRGVIHFSQSSGALSYK